MLRWQSVNIFTLTDIYTNTLSYTHLKSNQHEQHIISPYCQRPYRYAIWAKFLIARKTGDFLCLQRMTNWKWHKGHQVQSLGVALWEISENAII